MLDPVTAVGLAASIITIVDFTATLLLETKDFVESAADTLPENARLAELSQLTGALAEDVSKLSLASPQGKTDAILCDLSRQCQSEATDLIKLLDKLKLSGKKSTWKAVMKVSKTKWKRGEIAAKRRSLERVQKQLADQLLLSVRQNQMAEFREVKELVEGKSGESVQVLLSIKDQLFVTLSAIEQDIKENLNQTRQINSQTQQIKQLLLSADEERLAQSIISSLAYPGMSSRSDAIEEHHRDTFGWIFSDDDTPFKRWLQNGDTIFWVCGEAGSGKSTLMKFLRSSSATRDILQTWAGMQRLLILQHYFWVAGGAMQKSLLGMYRHLLYQALEVFPDLVPTILPEYWDAARSGGQLPVWNLERAFNGLLKLSQAIEVKTCIFVDGLDECESENGKHLRLIHDLKQLSATSRMRSCLASRPWQIFENAFEASDHKILLQDLNLRDIFTTVKDRLMEQAPSEFAPHLCQDELFEHICTCSSWKFKSDEERRGFSESERQVRGLIYDISVKAQGVFFWVSVVLDEICERLSSGHSPTQLRQYVDKFPSRLEQYFQRKVYERISATYRDGRYSETAMALRIAVVQHGLLDDDKRSYIPYMLLHRNINVNEKDGIIENAEFGMTLRSEESSANEIMNQIEQTRRYLAGCCKDLLKVTDNTQLDGRRGADVDFRHRMAYDFVMTGQMQNMINVHVPRHFLGADFGVQIALACFKIIFVPDDEFPSKRAPIMRCLYLAQLACEGLEAVREVQEAVVETESLMLQRLRRYHEVDCRCIGIIVQEGLYSRAVTVLIPNKCYEYVKEVLRLEPALACHPDFQVAWCVASGIGGGHRYMSVGFNVDWISLDILHHIWQCGGSPNVEGAIVARHSHVKSPWHALLAALWSGTHGDGTDEYETVDSGTATDNKPALDGVQSEHDELKLFELVCRTIEYGADITSPDCCSADLWNDEDFHTHDWRKPLQILSEVLSARHQPVLRALLERYSLPHTRERLNEARRERIKGYNSCWLGNQDLEFLGRPVRRNKHGILVSVSKWEEEARRIASAARHPWQL